VVQCEAEDKNARTPLHYACYYSSSEVIAEMCRLRANVNHTDKKRRTPLHVVVCRAHSGTMHTKRHGQDEMFGCFHRCSVVTVPLELMDL